jgi:hypothetical protein
MTTKLLVAITTLLTLFGCSTTTYKAGDICSVDNGDGKIGIVKVLAVEPGAIHLRLYKNKFENRPKEINTSELSLGRFGDKDGFGIGHVPLDINGFNHWKPEVLTNEKVTDKELEGYNMWKESQ